MGLLLSRVLELFAGNKNYRILMVGLDAAGKTTLLYKLKLDELVTTIPTIGFNVETVSYGNINFTVWDIGGQDRIRTLWRHYFQNTDAVIFVVDSNDLERINEAKYELTRIMEDSELTAKYLLVYANKQDLPSALTDVQVAERLSLSNLHNITWHVQASNAISGDGIYEGLQWISQQLKA